MAHHPADLKRSHRALSEAVQNTLETLAFQEAIPVESGSYDPLQGPLYVTTVEVKRPYAGTIRLIITREVAQHLIGSMLGNPGRTLGAGEYHRRPCDRPVG